MRKLLKLPVLLVSVLAVSLGFASVATAQVDWRDEREQGIRLEFAKNFSAAVGHYKKALAAAPTDASADATNVRVQLQTQIATCYLRQEQRLKALPYIESLITSTASLRAKNSVKADTEMYLVALVEECDSNHAALLKTNLKEWQQFNMLSQHICEVALPETLTPGRYSFRARCLIAAGDNPGALKFLNTYMKKLPSSDPLYLEMQLKQAALKNLLKQPEMLRDVSLAVAKTKSPVEAACMIGKAQTWATDYVGADQTLAKTYDKLNKQNKLSRADRINLLSTRLDNSLDCGRWAEAEGLARQCLALSPPEIIRNTCLSALSSSLVQQGKFKEAEKVHIQRRNSTYGFLADEERDATVESIKRRSLRK